MREYFPILFVGAVAGVFSLIFLLAWLRELRTQTAPVFDRNIPAGEIVRRMEGQTGVRRGVSCLALAKARHLGGEDGKARQCLLEARELLVGTAYLPAIDAALADIKHLD